MNEKPEKFIDENGLRLDGRKIDQIRDIKIEIGILNRADGSCYLEFGNNKIMAAVYGPREVHPRHQQKATKAIVRYKYNMASFSVEDRKRPGPDRRSIEVSKVSREAFEKEIFTELYPKSAIDIFIEILQADAGTRTAAINAASLALADAGIPMRGLISSCAVGKVDDTLILDLNKDEDNYGQADMPIAMSTDGKITLLQMDGHLTQEEFKKGLEMAQQGCREIYELQRKALIDHYNNTQKEIIQNAPVESVKDISTESATEENPIEDPVISDDVPDNGNIANDDEIKEDIPDKKEEVILDEDEDNPAIVSDETEDDTLE
ncbi:MAG: exosome complex exonuclease Rrp41 [Euryarchaeota archaeon]|nr:exosome complex exonuclease Rrp41 [Euryarchaeota archaeon]